MGLFNFLKKEKAKDAFRRKIRDAFEESVRNAKKELTGEPMIDGMMCASCHRRYASIIIGVVRTSSIRDDVKLGSRRNN